MQVVVALVFVYMVAVMVEVRADRWDRDDRNTIRMFVIFFARAPKCRTYLGHSTKTARGRS